MAMLLAVQWLIVAAVLGIVLDLLVRAGRSTRQQFAREPNPHAEIEGEQWWRCNHCRRRWHSVPGGTRIKRVARFRKWVRHRARQKGRQIPAWALSRGTRVCPSCTSRDIRKSSWQGAENKPRSRRDAGLGYG